jgi:ribonuclease P protein component
LVVLVAAPNDADISRIAVAAGRSVGSAVQRNRAKRRLREALRQRLNQIRPGWDLLVIARKPILDAEFTHLQAALQNLLGRANLVVDEYVE